MHCIPNLVRKQEKDRNFVVIILTDKLLYAVCSSHKSILWPQKTWNIVVWTNFMMHLGAFWSLTAAGHHSVSVCAREQRQQYA